MTYRLAAKLHRHFVVMSASADSQQGSSASASPPESSRKGLADLSEISLLPGVLSEVMSATSRHCSCNGMKGSTPSVLQRVGRSASNPALISVTGQSPLMAAGTLRTGAVGVIPVTAWVLTSMIAGSSTT
ncbi:hypothetical protein A5733_05680 [Mycobacterium sp. NS-7484]|nr:hypothetical protein [Mycobacterium sp. NS-7484]OMB99712.1 hypothetical protein A5733_05680 [Mycobacterium sp. NS-7484]